MSVKRYDRGQLLSPRHLDNGFVQFDAYLTRTGVFPYMNTDGSVRRELRTAEEVFHKDAMASLACAPVTSGHPTEGFVTARNRSKFSVGTTSNVRQDEDKVAGTLQVEDETAIAAVQRGAQEISCGYDADLDFTAGVLPNGERYDCIQRKIRYNHVALVPMGRAGPEIRIRMDNLDAELVASRNHTQENQVNEIEIEIAGVKVKVPATVAALREKEHKDAADALAAEKSAHETTKAKFDAASEELKKVKQAHADAVDPKRFDEAVKARVTLESKAREVLGAEATVAGSDRDVRVAVITKLAPSFKADGLSDEYVRARYDAALEFAAQSAVDGARLPATFTPGAGQRVDGQDTWALALKAKEDFDKRNAEAHKPKAGK